MYSENETFKRLVPYLFSLILFILLAITFYYVNKTNNEATISATELVNKNPEIIKEKYKNHTATEILKDLAVTTEFNEITPPTASEVKKPPVVLPILMFDTKLGITVDKNGNTIVGLYDVARYGGKYRRYLTYVCGKDGKLIPDENGYFFFFGKNKETEKDIPVEIIYLSNELYQTNEDDTIVSVLLGLNTANRVSFTLHNTQQVILNITERKTNTLPCMK